MKKLIYLLILLFTPVLVLADSASPSIEEYDAIVINKNGAKTSSTDDSGKIITVPYNTKIHIYNEYDGEAETDCQNIKYCSVKVKIKDILPVKEEIIPSKKDFEQVNVDVIIFNKKGIKLNKGPADAYKKYDTVIPYMTKLKASYALMGYEGESSEYYNWLYVSDGTNKGWIYVNDYYESLDYNKNIVGVSSSMPLLTFKNINIVDDTGKVLSTIPGETVLNDYYYLNVIGKYYIDYNGTVGFITLSESINDNYYTYYSTKASESYALALKKLKITSLDGETRIEVPYGERVKLLYYGNVCVGSKKCYDYVEYKNKKGFINVNDVLELSSESSKRAMLIKKESILYNINLQLDEQHGNNLKVNKYIEKYRTSKLIPANTSVTTYDEYIFYDTNELGNIIYENAYKFYLVVYDGVVGLIQDDNNTTIESKEETPINNEIIPNENNDVDISNKPNNIILYAIIGSLIVAITMVATIIIINGNKSEKRKEEKKEIKKEEIVKQEDKKEEHQEEKKEKTITEMEEPKKKIKK